MSRSPMTTGTRRRALTSTAALLLLAFAAEAREVVRQGVLYSGGTRLEAPDEGVAFTVPEGWQGIWPQGAEFLVMQPADTRVTILVTVQEASEQEIRATMAAPIALGDGIVLRPTGGVETRDGALQARYDVAGAQIPLTAWGAAKAGGRGVAVAFLLVAPPDRLESHLPTLRALIGTPDLLTAGSGSSGSGSSASTPSQPAATSQGGGGDRWDVYLKGKYLVRYYTTTGYTDETHLWLCSDGTFYRQGAGGGFGGGASGAVQANSSGRWEAIGAGATGGLTLHYGDGSVAQHELSYDYAEDHLFVDGKRWLRGTNEQCH